MIRFFVLKGLKVKEIYEQLLEAYKESYFTWRITYEKAVWKFSAAHVYNSTKPGSKTNFSA